MSRARRFADKGNLHSLVLNATDGSASDIGEKVLLDGTDTSASNSGFTILLEDATGNADVRITSQLHNGVFNFTSVPKNDNNPAFYVTTLTDDVTVAGPHCAANNFTVNCVSLVTVATFHNPFIALLLAPVM